MTRTPGTRRRRAGRVMIGVGIVGIVVAAVGVVAGWQFLGRINAATGDSLDVTIETLDSVEESVDLVDGVLDAVAETVETTAATLTTVVESFDASTGVVDEIKDLTDTVGPTLGDAAANLRSLEGVAGGIDSLLEGLSNIPFAPSYDSDLGLEPAIGELADDLAVLPDEFAATSTELDGFIGSLEDLSVQVDRLTRDISDVTAELDGRDEVIARYRENISSAQAVAVDTRDGLDGDLGLLRILLVVGAINFAVGQIVPIWVGRSLLREADAAESLPRPRLD